MPVASLQDSSFTRETSFRRRAIALLLALIANILIILMLLFLAPAMPGRPDGDGRRGPISFDLSPEAEPAAAPAASAKQAKPRPTPPTASRRKPIIVPRPPRPQDEPTPPLKMIILTKEDFAAADIAKMPAARSSDAAPAQSAAAGGGSAAGDSKLAGGKGPHGEPLYAAEWYIRPTDAEVSYYLRPTMPHEGAGLVACRTIPDNRVEDCVELGEEPPSSGFARAVRQAAGQFRVRAPRLGGKPMIGTWVKIRIDYSVRGGSAG